MTTAPSTPRARRASRTARITLIATACLALLGASGAFAANAPGTATQVAALIKAAPSIRQLPGNLTPSLSTAGQDTALVSTPGVAFCDGGGSQTHCTFGDTKGTKSMVLFGDSHAFMWFPAVNAIAKAAKWKLYFLSLYGCPVADLSVWYTKTNAPYSACNTWRAATIARINALNPSLVIVAETHYLKSATQQPITNAQFQAALAASLNALHSSRMKKVLIGDTVTLPVDPVSCLAANPTAVQKCSVASGLATQAAQRAVDVAAAKSAKVLYVNELPWTCSATCTAVVGNMVVYYATQHLTATYDLYLTKVFRAAIAADLH